jgi:hypothetical protein
MQILRFGAGTFRTTAYLARYTGKHSTSAFVGGGPEQFN